MVKFEELEVVLKERLGGVLKSGSHLPDGEACILEAVHIAIKKEWSDAPGFLPDIRPLNDARWSSDEIRTLHMMRLTKALWNWSTWSTKQRIKFVTKLAELTIRKIFPPMLRRIGLIKEAERCEKEGSRDAADAAADAALAASAADAALAAADAALAAADADSTLILSVDIWIEATKVN